jgi:hypothetical protein
VRTEEISQAGRGVNAGAPSSGGIRDTIGAAASSLLSSLVSGVTGAASAPRRAPRAPSQAWPTRT